VDFPSDTRPAPRREEHYVLEDKDESDRMLLGALAYVFWPFAIAQGRWDPFVRFHVRQGAGLWIAFVFARIWAGFTWSTEIPEVGWLGYGAVVLLACWGIRNALALEWRPMPWIGWIFDRWLPVPKRLAEPAPRRWFGRT
jgi:hypothetical protein